MQLLAALPTIFSAIRKVSELFGKGKEAVKEVKGDYSIASSPEELRSEVESMTPEQQNRWAEIMSKQVDLYAKQNERLAIEIGLVDSNITSKLSSDAADEIAYMRMTTRPWTVRLMVHFVLFPFYLVILDVVQLFAVSWLPFLTSWGISPFLAFDYVFGMVEVPAGIDASNVDKFLSLFKESGGNRTMAAELYMDSIPWVVSVILGYMGLREIGKARGHKDADAPVAASTAPISVVGKTLADSVGLVSQVKDWFKKK